MSTAEDEVFLRLLVDLRTCIAGQTPVQGCITALLVSAASAATKANEAKEAEVISFGYVRSLLVAHADAVTEQDERRRGKLLPTDIHAEADAITSAAASAACPPLAGATLYVSSVCCPDCFALAVGAGVARIVTPPPPSASFYASGKGARTRLIAAAHGVEIVQLAPGGAAAAATAGGGDGAAAATARRDGLPPHRPMAEAAAALERALPARLFRRLGRGGELLEPAALRGAAEGGGGGGGGGAPFVDARAGQGEVAGSAAGGQPRRPRRPASHRGHAIGAADDGAALCRIAPSGRCSGKGGCWRGGDGGGKEGAGTGGARGAGGAGR